MNRTDNLERELAAWFIDSAAPRTPDYTDDIVRLTAGLAQRPRWTFPERWLPMSVITLARRSVRPVPWRTVGMLAVLAVLIAALLAAYIGSRPRVPPPFGLARNGLVAYEKGGDIYTVDPVTGSRRLVVGGPDTDSRPVYSLDGTRLAFRRAGPDGERLVFSDADGSGQVVAESPPLVEVNTIAWSPDGRSVAFASTVDGNRPILIVDTRTGETRTLDVGIRTEEVSWRPPDGRQLLFLGGDERDQGIYLVSADGTGLRRAANHQVKHDVYPAGWLPSGEGFAFDEMDPSTATKRLHIVAVDGSTHVVIHSSDSDRFNAGYGHLSNDGTRVVFLDGGGPCAELDECNWLSVASVTGGRSTRITPDQPAPYGLDYQWSPDDRWIMTRDSHGGQVSLIDPATAAADQPAWVADGTGSWQRIAP